MSPTFILINEIILLMALIHTIMENEETNQNQPNYQAPDFEIVTIEFEQNILAGSGPDFGGEDIF